MEHQSVGASDGATNILKTLQNHLRPDLHLQHSACGISYLDVYSLIHLASFDK